MDWIIALNPGLLGRLLLASVLGGVIGLERELSGKPAGLRTNLLICVGAALLTELSISVADHANLRNLESGTVFRADPARIAAQIVSGIGFLGAGTILQARGNVLGLTTAATIWVVAAIGMAVGAREYLTAIGATAIVFFALRTLSRIEGFVLRRRGERRYLVRTHPKRDLVEEVEKLIRDQGLTVDTASVEKQEQAYEVSFDVSGPLAAHRAVFREVSEHAGVVRITRVL
ncbi:MAG: MgtC/SapB family protein [Longimicrobiaceae bacterium]